MSEQLVADNGNQTDDQFMSRKAFFIVLIFAVLASVLLTQYFSGNLSTSNRLENNVTPISHNDNLPITQNLSIGISAENPGDFVMHRENKFKFIKPLLFADMKHESEKFVPLNAALSEKMQELASSNLMTNATVYLKELYSVDWTQVNGYLKYLPGSMLKVATFITILKQAEMNPSFLEKQITLTSHADMGVLVNTPVPLVVGKWYSSYQLLQVMIEFSDNDATFLLKCEMD